ncbi:hypothetical protein BST81_10045 [Leptolyngbya sp. 'hensonii']|uniref:glycosyltransferase family 2 protein n=1 Tax=Leptolyngbya sp. 'hensonii' TaxID=1922337 RepID=UPI00094F65FB|nr:glycosyltransferase family 2 protein [Leptolyngbya sp. 'hensonii']OLP18618.1 hypothetical protein BST81_10045 [Leptolyngbya sp. 'hensonii']
MSVRSPTALMIENMDSQPLVSVLIPTYNRCQLLTKAIRSAQIQSYEALEIIVSDNASQDETPALIRPIAAADARVRYFRFDQGVEPAQNWRNCLHLATGKYCFILCDDDFLLDLDYVKNSVALLEKHQAGLLVTDCILGTHIQDYIYNQATNLRLPEHIPGREFFLKFWEGSYSPPVISGLFHRELAIACDAFTVGGTALMDIELWLKLMLLTDVVYNPFPSVLYYQHGANWLFSMSLDDRRIDIQFIDRVFEFAQARSAFPLEVLLPWRARMYQYYIHVHILNECLRVGIPEAEFAAFGAAVGAPVGISYRACQLAYRSRQSRYWQLISDGLGQAWRIPWIVQLYKFAKDKIKL